MTVKNLTRYFSIILIVAMLLSMNACAENRSSRYIEDCYQIRTNCDLTYSYWITDFNDNILFRDNAAIKQPNIKLLSASVLEVSLQTGTGLSTNWAIYCDVEAGKVSEKFFHVLGAKDGYVFYVNYEDNTHSIICQNIFDAKALTQEYKIDDPLLVPDSLSTADFETEGVAKFSYLTGDTAITQKYITIYFPD